ncbi:hypothetical protein PybrP1_006122 [[Pythium] brassicae (nom. inval.)]|nr:hypothetical protein PybrP1_006122 [[Pythium] brassicae (nom. inval.)]
MPLWSPMRLLTLRFALDAPPGHGSSTQATSRPRAAKRQRTAATDPTDLAPRSIATVRLVELIRELQGTADHDDATHFGLFVWPSAEVLAHFVARHRERVVRGKVVLEIGCGTGLPGILAAVCGDPAAVYLTDRSDAADIQRNVEANIALNGIGSTTRFLALDWGRVDVSDQVLGVLATVDVLLAADCFYRSEGARVTSVISSTDFEKVLASVALVFRCNPRCRLYVTYQLRSITRSIAPLLARWRMTARAVDTKQFLPSELEGDAAVLSNYDNDDSDNDGDGEHSMGVRECTRDYANIFLYEISPAA